jgi:hypothetical protein
VTYNLGIKDWLELTKGWTITSYPLAEFFDSDLELAGIENWINNEPLS